MKMHFFGSDGFLYPKLKPKLLEVYNERKIFVVPDII